MKRSLVITALSIVGLLSNSTPTHTEGNKPPSLQPALPTSDSPRYRSLYRVGERVPCGDDSNVQPACTLQPFNWHDHFTPMSVLGSQDLAADSITSTFASSEGQLPGASTFLETWYVPSETATGRQEFYRHFSLPIGDHLDSPLDAKAIDIGYVLDATLGFPWTSMKEGAAGLRRLVQPVTFDHRTTSPFIPIPANYMLSIIWDESDPEPRFGYPRFGTEPEECTFAQNPVFQDVIENSVMRTVFNRVEGGFIEELWYKPLNLQLVVPGIGTGIQSTIFLATNEPIDCPPSCCVYNPTEAGGVDSWNFSNTKRYKGSPILSRTVGPGFELREVRPMNFSFDAWSDTSPTTPLLWNGTFLKGTAVGVEDPVDPDVLLEDVLGIEFLPRTFSGVLSDASLNTTFWLQLQHFGDANSQQLEFSVVDLATGGTTSSPQPEFNEAVAPCGGVSTTNDCPGKGILVSRLDGSFAAGFVLTTGGFYRVRYHCGQGEVIGGDCSANQNLVMNMFQVEDVETVYRSKLDALLIVGDRATVLLRMQQLSEGAPAIVFVDGFESGDLAAWTLGE